MEQAKVWCMDEYTWYAGYSLEQIIAHRLDNESSERDDIIDEMYCRQLVDAELDSMKIRMEDGNSITFRQALERAVADGDVPCCLASSIE